MFGFGFGFKDSLTLAQSLLDGTHVAQAGPQRAVILLPLFPKCWDYSCPPLGLVLYLFYLSVLSGAGLEAKASHNQSSTMCHWATSQPFAFIIKNLIPLSKHHRF